MKESPQTNRIRKKHPALLPLDNGRYSLELNDDTVHELDEIDVLVLYAYCKRALNIEEEYEE